jgi:cytochrome c6
LKRLLIAIAVILITTIYNNTALAENAIDGAKLFETHCAGCHINGGNIIRRNKTLKQKALQRNKMDTPEAIKDIITNGKNNMSAYRDRLTEQEIEAVTNYVLNQAQNNWKS